MNKVVLIILLVIVLVGGGYFLLNMSSAPAPSVQQEQKPIQTPIIFESPKKSAHYESNTPEHGATLAGVPINVVINFNFDLTKPSYIKIEKDGKDYGIGETVIDKNRLSMRRNMDPTSPDGLYTVSYNACWPDGTCHDGHFQFAINRSKASTYEDLTGKKEVTVRLASIKFMPRDIKVGKGTKITWINDDSVEHYVNTDSHPAHTYYLDQNSKALKKGDTYSLTFNISGIYPYHCSAHADSMKASIIVE